MNQKQMDKIFDKVCDAWNNHDFNKTTNPPIITKSSKCIHKFTKYDILGDNTKEYYCAKCGLCEKQ